jgi:hypothetical protein
MSPRPPALGAALAALLLLLAPSSALLAHDLFLKLNSYFLPTGATRVRVPVLNGTFTKSESALAADRLADLSLVSAAGRQTLSTDAWDARRDSSFVSLVLAAPGTYVVGASTRPRTLTLQPGAFNAYLRDEGLTHVLAERTERGELAEPARERYAKHVKALFQKGAVRTPGFDAALGYPAELVPTENPYALGVGDTLVVRCLVDGRPAPGEAVIAGGVRPSGATIAARRVRADSAGLARIPIVAPGRWYAKFIHMERVTTDRTVDYESKWATMTFGVRE